MGPYPEGFPLSSTQIMMSGCGILTNGKGTRREYGQCNLDELVEADRIGLIRQANGELHFYVNGRDQGVAASNVPSPVWGVVGMGFDAHKFFVIRV